MQFRLITIFASAAVLSACAASEPALTKAQRDILCHAFWDTEDADSSLLVAQNRLYDAMAYAGDKNLDRAREAVSAAQVDNAAARAQLDVVCGPSKP